MSKDLKVPFKAPLNEMDTEEQTYGCRAINPDICIRNGLIDVCAFVSIDSVCRKPSRAWKNQYYTLLKEEKNETP